MYSNSISDGFSQIDLKNYPRTTQVAKWIGIGASLLVLRAAIDRIKRNVNNYPPGGNGIPLIGSMYSILRSMIDTTKNKENSKYFDEVCEKYGSVSMIQIGLRDVIIINDLQLCKKLFIKKLKEFMNHDDGGLIPNHKAFTEVNGEMMFYRRHLIQNSFMLTLNSNHLNKNISNIFENVVFKNLDNYKNSNTNMNDTLSCNLEYTIFSLIFSAIFGDSNINPVPQIDSKEFIEYQENNKSFKFASIALIY